jgi:hypothetical protein
MNLGMLPSMVYADVDKVDASYPTGTIQDKGSFPASDTFLVVWYYCIIDRFVLVSSVV